MLDKKRIEELRNNLKDSFKYDFKLKNRRNRQDAELILNVLDYILETNKKDIKYFTTKNGQTHYIKAN